MYVFWFMIMNFQFRTFGKLYSKLAIFQPNKTKFEDIQEIQEEEKEEAEEDTQEFENKQRRLSEEMDPLEKLIEVFIKFS